MHTTYLSLYNVFFVYPCDIVVNLSFSLFSARIVAIVLYFWLRYSQSPHDASHKGIFVGCEYLVVYVTFYYLKKKKLFHHFGPPPKHYSMSTMVDHFGPPPHPMSTMVDHFGPPPKHYQWVRWWTTLVPHPSTQWVRTTLVLSNEYDGGPLWSPTQALSNEYDGGGALCSPTQALSGEYDGEHFSPPPKHYPMSTIGTLWSPTQALYNEYEWGNTLVPHPSTIQWVRWRTTLVPHPSTIRRVRWSPTQECVPLGIHDGGGEVLSGEYDGGTLSPTQVPWVWGLKTTQALSNEYDGGGPPPNGESYSNVFEWTTSGPPPKHYPASTMGEHFSPPPKHYPMSTMGEHFGPPPKHYTMSTNGGTLWSPTQALFNEYDGGPLWSPTQALSGEYDVHRMWLKNVFHWEFTMTLCPPYKQKVCSFEIIQ